jgi:Domain of Unknown Function (DUF1080)
MFRPLLLFCCVAVGAFASGDFAMAADAGFQPIFNGRDLTGWEGDLRFWSVTDGAIRGETSLQRLCLRNTFLLWKGGVLKDFELHLKFRLRNGNSGIQYRSKDLGKWSVAGYQSEIDNTPGATGFLYEERGRKFLAYIGEAVEIDGAGKPHVTAVLAEKKALIARDYYRPREWNDYRITAVGNHLEHYVNGVKTVDVTDDDISRRASEGILALQIHCGPPMLVEFKDILLKNL